MAPAPSRRALLPTGLATERERQLEQELWSARHAIVHLAPDEFHEELTSYLRFDRRDDTYDWLDHVAQAVIERAEIVRDDPSFGARAKCPLCGRGSIGGYLPGFSLPEGLRMHLTGAMRARQCVVTEAAHALARDYWDKKFAAGEHASSARENARVQQRRQSEILYRVSPTGPPVLIDEGLVFFISKPRMGDDDQVGSIKWAEQRLFSLGFTINVDGNQKSYTRRFQGDAEGELVIYADPRATGQILFHVYRQRRRVGVFKIRDQWKNNLDEKIKAGVKAAASRSR